MTPTGAGTNVRGVGRDSETIGSAFQSLILHPTWLVGGRSDSDVGGFVAMKNKKTIKHTIDVVVTESVTCDICKQTVRGDSWGKGFYDIRETEVRMKIGSDYLDSCDFKETKFDICPECFNDKLIPALRQLGAEATVSTRDW